MKSLLSIKDFSPEEIKELISVAEFIKSSKNSKINSWSNLLYNKNIILYFEKPSLRTHLTFDIAVRNLGGNPIYFDNSKQMGREPDKDIIRNISRWADGIVARVYKQETLETFVKEGTIPVINALSDLYHPCQALADYMTIKEITGKVYGGIKVAYVGEPNNVSNSLMICGSKLGIKMFKIITPESNKQDIKILEYCKSINNNRVMITENLDMLQDCDVIYCDTWCSMGDNTPVEEKIEKYLPYQVNSKLLNYLNNIPFVLHCLPCHRGQEITDDVIEKHPEIYQLAENRLWTEMALLRSIFI